MKLITILGARPQFIKASVVSAAISACDQLTEIVIHTGQHFDANMSQVFFNDLGMKKPIYHLDIHSGRHGDMTGRMLIEIEKVLISEKPDGVMVYGDTNSTLAGALSAVKLHIPVVHVEAGLRSFNMAMPEEINRILTDRISSVLFCPTETAVQNLLKEGYKLSSESCTPKFEPLIHNVGDVMYDVALHHGSRVSEEGGLLHRLGLKPKGYILATIHRAENTDHPERLVSIVDALSTVAKDIPVVWPMHPRTRNILAKRNCQLSADLKIIDPIGYLDMVQMEKYATLIATDSGGVQKEAFFYRVPCVTLRDETEWVELVEAGWNRLAPPIDTASVLLALRKSIGSIGQDVKPYGVGDASKRIVECLAKNFA